MKVNSPLGRKGISTRALTLVELVVVLLILVVLTSVALRSTEGIVSQGRFDATARTLRNIELAVLGDSTLRQPDGTPIINGFVADVGRLPKSLTELVTRPTDVAAFTISEEAALDASNNDEDIHVGSGWRGPYLRLPIGEDNVVDGFGLAFDKLDADGNIFVGEEPIAMLLSSGSSREAPFNVDQAVVFRSNGDSINQYQEDVSVTIQFVDVNGDDTDTPPAGVTSTKIRLFQPDGNGSVNFLDFDGPMPLVSHTHEFTNVPIGYRVLRVYDQSDQPLTPPAIVYVLPNTTIMKTFRISP